MGGVQKDLAETLSLLQGKPVEEGCPSLVSARRDSPRYKTIPRGFFFPFAPPPFRPLDVYVLACFSSRAAAEPEASDRADERRRRKSSGGHWKKSEDHYFSRLSPLSRVISRAILLRFHPLNFLPRRPPRDSRRGRFHRRALLHPFARGIARIRGVYVYNIYIIYVYNIYNYMYIVYIQQVVKVLKNIYVINYKSNYHHFVNSFW